MFCPLIKGSCKEDCIFYKDNKCNLLKTLSDIEYNTGSDHSESWAIKNELDSISEKLDEIIKKL